MAVPAGYWRRHAAWSLDAAVVGGPAALLAWPATAPRLPLLAIAQADVGATLADSAAAVLAAGAPLPAVALALLAEPRLAHAIATLQHALWQVASPSLAAFAVLAALYWPGFEGSRWQATPGKRALGLVVVDTGGGRIGHGRAALRHLAGTLSWLTANLGHALAAWPPSKRALHDRLAGTCVVQVDGCPPMPSWAMGWLAVQAIGVPAAMAWLARPLFAGAARALGA